jgi:hypothetical protein
MKASEFEQKVWAVEGIRIVLRTDPNTEVKDYGKKNAADEGLRITELLEKRVAPCVGDIPYVVIQSDGEEPHGKVILRTIRKGYKP